MTTVYLRSINISDTLTPPELSAYRSAQVRRLLADALGERYGERTSAWSLAKTAEGKPYLSRTAADGLSALPFISLSHSGRWVICALSDTPVGVDVQVVRPISDAVLRRFMPDATPDSDDRSRTRLWTYYEACLKRYGSRAEMVADAAGQCYESIDLEDAVVTVCHGDDAVDWIEK